MTMKATAKIAAVVAGLAIATSMLSLAPMAQAASLTSSQIQSILSLLSSFGANSATIANVNAALNGTSSTSTSGGSTTTTTTASCAFSANLTIGSTGAAVTCLQQALIAGSYSIPAGATGYFGAQTQAAVIAWQKAVGVSPAAGYFGAISRAHWNLGGSSSSSTTTTTTTTTTGTTAGTGNGLKVSLSATSPSGSVLVQGQGIGDLGDFVFANPTAAPINVTALTFKRTGVSNDATLANVYLYNGVVRITDSAGVSNGQFSYSDPAAIFTVPAGQTYTVSVRSDIAASTSGQQIGVSLVSVSSNATLDSSASFPINSGYQTISAATLATVDYSAATPASGISISAQNDYPIWQDTITVSSNAVYLNSLKFTNIGSISPSSLLNLRLYVDGTQVGSAIPTMAADRSVTFDFSAAPKLLSTQSHVVKVLANIANAAGYTIQFSIQRSSDGMFVDSQLNQPVTPTKASSAFSSVSTAAITLNSVTTGGGVSVSKDPASPSSSIAKGSTSVKLASFDMLASGENVKVSDLYVFAATSTVWSSTSAYLTNGKIFVNGVQVGSTKTLGNTSGTATDFSLGSSLILPAGQTVVVDIYADAKTAGGQNINNGDSITVTLVGETTNAQGQSSLGSTGVPKTNDVSGNAVTVSSSSLTANKYSGYGNQQIIPGSNNAKLGAFSLSTNSTEGVTVNTIAVDLSANNAASITNLTLKDDATGTILGSVVTTPASGDNSFYVNLDIPVSSTKTIGIYGNILSSASVGTIIAKINTTTTGVGDITGISASVATELSLQTITIGTGTLTVAKGAGDPVSNNVVAGQSSVNVGQFNFAATNSNFTVQNLAILVPNGAATSVTNVTVSYKDANGATQTATSPLSVSPTATYPYATATFTGLTMYVPANDSANLDVSVGIPSIASGAVSGAGINVSLDEGTTTNSTFKATNSAGTALAYAQGTLNSAVTKVTSAGTFYVRKSIPTFAVKSVSGSTPNSPLYQFSITADPAGAIEWSQLTFKIATSTATVTGLYLTDDSSGIDLIDNGTTVETTGVTGSQIATIDLLTNTSLATYQQIAAGQTKTYDLYGTVSAYGAAGSTLTISLAAETSSTPAANAAATTGLGKTVWSDRSSASHTISTPDWTNGALLKNFTNSQISYSK